MATQFLGPVKRGQSEMKQTIQDVSATDGSVCFAGTFQNATFGHSPKATIKEKVKGIRDALFVNHPDMDREALARAKGERADGTCEWILQDPKYQSWLAGHYPVLQISGGPGKGKTVLSLFLTEQLAAHFRDREDRLLFFFCRFQDDKYNDPHNVLRSLTYQLLEFCQEGSKVTDILKYFDSAEKTKDILSNLEGLWRILEMLLSQPGLPKVWCIIDGIDECRSSEALTGKFHEYCRRYRQEDGQDKFQLLILGRDTGFSDVSHGIMLHADQSNPESGDDEGPLEPSVRSPMPSRDIDNSRASHVIRLDTDHRKPIKSDVEIFITSSLQPLEKVPRFTQIRSEVTEILVRKAEGTFLWVSFVIAELRRKKTCLQIMDTLRSFPKGLNPTFARMLNGIDLEYREASACILKWVTFAERPLTLTELTAATAETVQVGYGSAGVEVMTDMVQILRPFLEVHDDRVFFVHQSAREYLLESEQHSESPLEGYRFIFDQCHGLIAHKCLGVLKKAHCQDTSDTVFASLLSYAEDYWDYHTRLSDTCSVDINRSFFESMVLQKACIWPIYPENGPPPLHLASKHGIVRWLEALHQYDARYWRKNINLRHRGLTPLDFAIMGQGHETTIRFLLQHGADSQNSMQNAFLKATENGQSTTVQLLLEYGVTHCYSVQGKLLNWLWSKFLYQTSLEKVLEPRSKLFSDLRYTWLLNRTMHHQTLLGYAAKHGGRRIVELVLDYGVDSDALDYRSFRYALCHAAVMGDLDVLELLLDRGADIETRALDGETALALSAYYAHFDTVELLVKRFANIETTDKHGKTPLILSTAGNGRDITTDITRYLIDHGANVNARDGLNETALMQSLFSGSHELLELLLNSGADVGTNDMARSNRPLCLMATGHWSGRILTFLLDRGADINGVDTTGFTPLIYALLQCNTVHGLGMLPLLPEERVMIQRKYRGLYLDLSRLSEGSRRPRLPLLSLKQQETTVQCLLNHGADVNMCGRIYLYEPLLNSRGEPWDILRSVEEDTGGVVLDATPIICAARIGLDWAINLLAERGADCNKRATEWYLPKRNGSNRIPSIFDRWQRYVEEHDVFISMGRWKASTTPLPRHVCTRKAGSALVYASMGGHLTTVRLLLNLGADTSIEDGFGMTALTWATKKGFVEIEEVLKAHDESRS